MIWQSAVQSEPGRRWRSPGRTPHPRSASTTPSPQQLGSVQVEVQPPLLHILGVGDAVGRHRRRTARVR